MKSVHSQNLVWLLIAWIALAHAYTKSSAQFDGNEKEALGRAVITGYAANVNSFVYYKCRYRCTNAEARTVQDAIRGVYLNARSFDNRLVVDGEKDLYEGFAPPPDPKTARPAPGEKGKKGMFIIPSQGSMDKYMGDGQRELDFGPFMRTINLFSSGKNYRGLDYPPLGMHYVGHRNRFGPDVLLSKPEMYAFSVDGPEDIDGRPVVTVRFKEKHIFKAPEGPLEFTKVFSFDQSRGCMPIRMTTLWNGKPKKQVFVTLRECSNQRWFPERTVIVYTPDKRDALYSLLEIKVLELDTDQRPDRGEFRLKIPAGTAVLEFGNPGPFFKLRQDEEISIDDLPTLFEMLKQVEVNPRMDTAIPHSHPYGWIRWPLGILGVLVALGCLVFVVRRRGSFRKA
jgi:hypothetical protein